MVGASPVPALQKCASVAGDGATIVGVLAIPGSRPLALVDAALKTDLSTQKAGFVNAAASTEAAAVALVAPGFGDDEGVGDTLGPSFVISLSGIVVLNARVADLARPSAAGYSTLASALVSSLELRVRKVAPLIPARRLLVVAVRDFDAEDVDQGELQTAVTEHLESAYAAITERPSVYAATGLSDIFDIRFMFVPNEGLFPDGLTAASSELSTIVRHSARSGYTDAGLTPETLVMSASRIWDALASTPAGLAARELPPSRELAATFACGAVMKSVFSVYESTTQNWKVAIESGRIIRDFGKECTKFITLTLEKYANDAAAYRSTRGFQRKSNELKAKCLADAYVLFAKQILKLREIAYQVFRGNLTRIRINDRVEKNVNAAVKDAENYFVEKAESLRCSLSTWRYDNERHELVNHMREDATERLQLARLQGNYVPPIRAPVAVAFHTLLSAPFGRDSRLPQPHPDEAMNVKFDKDKAKKASLDRSRPRQRRGYIITAKDKDILSVDEYNELYGDFFADLPPPPNK